MAITLSGQNNVDKITASDGVIDVISGVNHTGVVTATTFKGDFEGNITGNVTGNINNTTLLFQIGGAEKVRIASNGRVGINTTVPADLLSIGAAANTLAFGAKDTTRGNHIWQLLNNDNEGNAEFRMYKNSVTGTHAQSINFATSGDDNYILDGNFGIGTNNPASLLHLENNAPVLTVKATNASSGFRINVKGQSSGQLLRIQDDNTTKFVLEEGGNVGIGTDNPAFLLDVYKTSNDATIRTRTTTAGAWYWADSASTGYYGIRLASSGTEKWFVGSYASHNFQIKDGSASGGTERFTIVDGTGKVGIGTDNPTAHLQVYRATQYANNPIIQARSNNGSTNELKFEIDGDGDGYFDGKVGIGITNPVTKLHLQDGNFTIKSSGECGPYLYRNNSNGPDLVFHSGGGSSFSSPTASGDTNLVGNINFAGYDGSTYQRRATINGVVDGSVSSNTVPTALMFRTGTTSAVERLRITSGGTFGFNTSTIRENIHTHQGDSNQNYLRFTNTGTGTGTSDGFNIGITASEEPIVWNFENTDILFATNNLERLRIDSSGNVGIDKTSGISARLHIGSDSNNGSLSQLVKLANDSSGAGTGTQINMGAGHANESTAACIAGFYDGTGTAFIVKTAGTFSNQSTVAERLRITSAGHMGLGDNAPAAFTNYTNFSIHGASGGAITFGDDGTDEWEIYAGEGSIRIYDRANTTERLRITDGGKIGIAVQSPFSRLQCGGHTFSGGHGMYNNNRVGMSNHGNLTGLMLASTYNDANHPEYGVVFVQGPSTSSYNVWSISPDGPAKGNSLNLHYGAQNTNIHAPGNRKFEFRGDGIISKPYQVAWSMHSSLGQTNLNTGDKVAFNQSGSGFGGSFGNRNHGGVSTSDNSFTAPVTGLYLTIVTMFFYTDNMSSICSIVPRINNNQLHNGSDTIFYFAVQGETQETTHSGTLLLHLNKDDELTVHRRTGGSGTHKYYGAHSQFQGYLVG